LPPIQRAAGQFRKLYASAGVYPHNTPEIDDAVLAKLDSLLAEPEVIACGEIGLDYYHEGAPHASQREGLVRQLEIAAARKRPILIHCRPKDAGVPSDRSSSLGWTPPTHGTIFSRFWRLTGGRPAWEA
jgi:Tat protein secretion system quality control protein TatD with DNase activity